MRNFKKFLALVLATLMVFSVAVISTSAEDVLVAANTSSEYTEAAQHLAALKIMKGDENGNLMLDSGVTRYQAALFFVQALTGETDAAAWNADKSVYFNDVPEYGTAIDYAYDLGIIIGRGDGTYGYNDPITYQDLLVMAVRALGYETENMSYPNGYTTAARTLGLTQNIAIGVGKTAPLKRGETAQIIWDMLGTQVAITDSFTGKILYPGQRDIWLEAATGKTIEEYRTTLLANFSDATLDAVITTVDTAKKTATVVYGTDSATVKLADLGLTADTAKINYLGLPVSLFVDCAADEFADKYENGKASIVFANYPSYTTVENLSGTASAIKVTDDTLTLNGTKFAAEDVTVKVFGNDGWEDMDFADFKTEYAGDKDHKGNTFAKISYLVTDGKVEALYTPYVFAQYQVFTAKDATTAKDADFAAYSENYGKDYKLFGSNAPITANTTSVSNRNGAAAKTLTVAGEAIKSGDFMYYAYNDVDNVLTVALNCGTFQTGRLTGYTENNGVVTVKISGASYTLSAEAKATFNADDYTKKAILDTGKDNAKFLVINGKIQNLTTVSADAAKPAVNVYDFAIISTDLKTVAGLLGETYKAGTKVNAGTFAEGFYVGDNGLAVAVMNKLTGKWELGYVKGFATGYDAGKDKFATTLDFSNATTLLSFAKLGVTVDDSAFDNVATQLNPANHIVAIVNEKDGVYTFAEATPDVVPRVENEKGVTMTSSADVTNYLTNNDKVDAVRVAYTANTSFIVISPTGEIYQRFGRYDTAGNSNKAIGVKSDVYYASSDLIVLVQKVEGSISLAKWAGVEEVPVTVSAGYYVVTPSTFVEYDINEKNEVVVVIKGMFDLLKKSVAADITLKADAYTALALDLKADNGAVIKRYADGSYKKIASSIAGLEAVNDGYKSTASSDKSKVTNELVAVFQSYRSAITIGGVNADFANFKFAGEFDVGFNGAINANATKMNGTLITIDLTGLDASKYDYSSAYLDKEYTDKDFANKYGVLPVTMKDKDYWAYPITGDTVETFNVPTEGVMNQYIIDTFVSGETVKIPLKGNDDPAKAATVDVSYIAARNEAAGVAYTFIFRIITSK